MSYYKYGEQNLINISYLLFGKFHLPTKVALILLDTYTRTHRYMFRYIQIQMHRHMHMHRHTQTHTHTQTKTHTHRVVGSHEVADDFDSNKLYTQMASI